MEPLDPPRGALIEQIEAAFPDPGYPAERRLTDCTRPWCHDCGRLDAIFRGRRWREILNVPMFPDLQDVPTLLGDEALAYFVPALMIGCLNDPGEADVTLDFIAYTFLSGPTRHGLLETLTAAQQSAVYGYLAWWVGSDEGNREWEAKYQRLVDKIPPNGPREPLPLPASGP